MGQFEVRNDEQNSNTSFTPDRRQSKTFILSTNVDQKLLETEFRMPFVAQLATNGNQKHCFKRF